MIDLEHDLPITRQAEVLQISRGSGYYLPRQVSSADLAKRDDHLVMAFFRSQGMMVGRYIQMEKAID